jgi:hypothetical protein
MPPAPIRQPLEGSLDQEQLRRLVLAIRSATGIEARVWLTDVAGLSPAAATDLMRWSAQALLRAALADRPDLPGNDEPPGADHRRHPVGVEGD